MNLFAKEVVGFDGYTDRYGKIIMEEVNRWGEFWIVSWINEDGSRSQESYTKHTIKPAKDRARKIGVFYIED